MTYQSPTIGVIVALVGATIIITRGTIFARLQTSWPKFFTCSMCVGFWIGAVSMLVLRPGSKTWESTVDFFLDGCSISLLALAVDAVLLKLLGDPNDKD